jgi:hypothetical protein
VTSTEGRAGAVPAARSCWPSSSGDAGLVHEGKIDARGSSGGMITLASANGDVTIERDLKADGKPGDGGNIELKGGDVDVRGKLEADTNGGNGDSNARDGGGVIEAHAAGDLMALGRFRADAGCIGLWAAGTLSTPGRFTPTPVMSCGVCPSP